MIAARTVVYRGTTRGELTRQAMDVTDNFSSLRPGWNRAGLSARACLRAWPKRAKKLVC